MYIEDLIIEITRMCTLECEHCLRGERCNVFMSSSTINNIFKDIKNVDRLVITGGEPLLAINQLEEIINMIKAKNINIQKTLLITNCTVFNSKVLNALKELASLTKLDLELSYDMFHYIQLKELNLLEERQKNAEVFKELFNAHDYRNFEDNRDEYSYIEPVGRGKTLTDERLNEINSMSKAKYKKYYSRNKYMDLARYLENINTITGKTEIDVYGNITDHSLSFEEEDDTAKNYQANVNELGLKGAVIKRTKYLDDIYPDGVYEEDVSHYIKWLYIR
jgi:organic radical activating enzyme